MLWESFSNLSIASMTRVGVRPEEWDSDWPLPKGQFASMGEEWLRPIETVAG
jgi:hypothetical protein